MANKFTDAVFHAKLPAVDKAVLWAIAHRTDNATGSCYPSIKTVGKESGASTTIVKQVVAYAVSIGLLAIKARRDGNINLANEYVFCLSGLRWLERANSRYVPDGETDTGVRATLDKLKPQGGKQPMGGLADGPRVYKRPAQGWGGSRLKNSEVDLRSGTRHEDSDSTHDSTDKTQDTDQEPNQLCVECGATPDACICEVPVPPSIHGMASRIESSLVTPDPGVAGKLWAHYQSLNGTGELFLDTLIWVLDENDAERMSVHFPKKFRPGKITVSSIEALIRFIRDFAIKYKQSTAPNAFEIED